MPDQTISISDADLPIFEKAQQLAGENFSATLMQALRRFVEAREHAPDPYQEIIVRVGQRVRSLQRFSGRLLAKGHFGEGNDTYQESFEVYQTAKGNIALYLRKMPGWWFTGWPPHHPKHRSGKDNWAADWNEWSPPQTGQPWWAEQGQYALEVFENLEGLQARIPEELYKACAVALKGDSAEWLDI